MGLFDRKPQVAIQEVDRIRTVTVRTAEDEALTTRVGSYISRAETEYARLSQEVGHILDRRDVGKETLTDRETASRLIGMMTALHSSLSLIKGTDSISEGFRLDQIAFGRRFDRFPVTSVLSNSSPIYVN